MKNYIKYATESECVRMSLKVGAVVGTILAGINHFDDFFLYQKLTYIDIMQILITYTVPYSVSTYGYVSRAIRDEKFMNSEDV